MDRPGQAHQVGLHLGAVGRIVNLQCEPGHDLRLRFVADVDDPRHRERREAGRARRLLLGRAGATTRSTLVDKDHIGMAIDLYRDRVLGH